MSLYEYKVQKRNGEELDLADLKGKVVIAVNTATGCGFTPQYKGLEELYLKLHDKGLEILDFPCNQFGKQAPGSDEEIHEFCTAKYKTTFDQLSKIEVNGENESPVYTFLKSQIAEDIIIGIKNKMAMGAVKAFSKTTVKPEDIKWNFTKFLIDKEGNVVKRYSPTFKPEDMEKDVLELL